MAPRFPWSLLNPHTLLGARGVLGVIFYLRASKAFHHLLRCQCPVIKAAYPPHTL